MSCCRKLVGSRQRQRIGHRECIECSRGGSLCSRLNTIDNRAANQRQPRTSHPLQIVVGSDSFDVPLGVLQTQLHAQRGVGVCGVNHNGAHWFVARKPVGDFTTCAGIGRIWLVQSAFEIVIEGNCNGSVQMDLKPIDGLRRRTRQDKFKHRKLVAEAITHCRKTLGIVFEDQDCASHDMSQGKLPNIIARRPGPIHPWGRTSLPQPQLRVLVFPNLIRYGKQSL
jgi:hypothetical protein